MAHHVKDFLPDLPALELRDRLRSGAISALDLVEACLGRIAALEDKIGAWEWIDPDYAREQARRLDQWRLAGRPLGPLHGLPVGIKDIIDTKGIPTTNGTPIDSGRVPTEDAWVVSRLRSCGAIIMGKTVTTEGAYLHPNRTRNPHNPDHTPGGSSQGSAAAVAAGMVPLAIGTQTGGSVIRPASYCGVVGMKPSFGVIPRSGILPQSPSLDTVGVFARTIEDAALLVENLAGYDPADTATQPLPAAPMLATAQSPAPVRPTFASVRLPGWHHADGQITDAMAELAEVLESYCFDAVLPEPFEDVAGMRETINLAEMAKCYYGLERRGRDAMSDTLKNAMDRGKAIPARDYLAALDWKQIINAGLVEIFDRCDAIICPASTGPAPKGLESTGNAVFNGIWTLAGLPAVTLPIFTDRDGLPMGLQLVGRAGDDARLLRNARWLQTYLETLDESD
ncbi:MAG: amidase [Pseudomonadota bacterium]|nr:amidase [Pseudomonadota bacterium]MEE3070361.1 amidase [Pseudomonadota bacterium]